MGERDSLYIKRKNTIREKEKLEENENWSDDIIRFYIVFPSYILTRRHHGTLNKRRLPEKGVVGREEQNRAWDNTNSRRVATPESNGNKNKRKFMGVLLR